MISCYRCKKPIPDSEYLKSPSFKNMKIPCESCCLLIKQEEAKNERNTR